MSMEKISLKFHAAGGWSPEAVTPLVVSDFLKQFIHEDQFDAIICRQDATATALVFRDTTATLLRASGQGYVFVKAHVEAERWRALDLLWLPAEVTLVEAMRLATEEKSKPGSASTSTHPSALL